MQFIFLWSGNKPGFRKATIPAIENKIGTIGHWRDGKLYLPDPVALRAALPARYRIAIGLACRKYGRMRATITPRLRSTSIARGADTKSTF